ncbi:serine hydrolase [Pseudidiomarina sediminum]|uniref:Serine hydrolase n=1 Tax=Pseudidiomarina sediminum TaxID=431675 RepID=A0A432ZAH1_9GAMM|nr:serine hydrolase [Pseudidiomarina sediminum]RUO74900.1 serine hydrolase [Pseudidiomarina sediminum]
MALLRNSLALSALLLTTPLFAQSAETLRSTAEQTLEAFNIPGLAVVAVKDGEVILAEGFGVRDTASGDKVNADTLFGIASNTKAFTSAAIATLVEQGKLNWDDKVVTHLPEFRLADAELTAQLTIRDLLSHRSGLGLGAGDLMIWPNTDKSTADLLAGLAHVPVQRELRERFAYNNLMFVTAGEIIARVSGMPYGDYISQTFLQPLGMNTTRVGFSNIPSSNTNYAVGTAEMNGELHRFPLDYLEDFAAAGAMASSVNDLSKWLLTQLQGGIAPSGERLFSKDSQNTMWQVTTPLPVSDASAAAGTNFRGVGLGWFVKDYHGVKHVSHSGGILGMLSLTTLIPEKNFGMVVLSNQQAFGGLTAITEEALEELLNLPDRDWVAEEQAAYQEYMQSKAEFVLEQPEIVRDGLPLKSYEGTYTDAWYGDVKIEHFDDGLYINFTHTELLKGVLEHYNGDTFVVHWNEPLLEADAFIDFKVSRDNEVEGAVMEAVAPFTDFSFDFHNLRLEKN